MKNRKKRQKLPNFSPKGVIICKKTVKTGNFQKYWVMLEGVAKETALDLYTGHRDYIIFKRGKTYIYMQNTIKGLLLIKSEGGLWFPFRLNKFNEIFRFFI